MIPPLLNFDGTKRTVNFKKFFEKSQEQLRLRLAF